MTDNQQKDLNSNMQGQGQQSGHADDTGSMDNAGQKGGEASKQPMHDDDKMNTEDMGKEEMDQMHTDSE
jgi:hypothetical protein